MENDHIDKYVYIPEATKYIAITATRTQTYTHTNAAQRRTKSFSAGLHLPELTFILFFAHGKKTRRKNK